VSGRAVIRVTVSVALASMLFMAACGSDEPALTPAAATALQSQVTDARTAVADGEYTHAGELLDAIDARVTQLGEQGDVGGARARQVHHAVAEVRAALATYVATTTTTTTTRPKPTPTTSAPENGHGRDDNGKPGKGGKDD
jgi:hypothetical protein